ncbi:uncharacterized protein LOC126563122 [Anopheles maculipalpis]|uniref:uncharacterized protein LOC126563122 n=1 Tax=Anopheles maculipalpis TaxID=1496333 RepID=UPI0021593116|nr:uncharacterized protein LOC126563122 [Anopheles maculipalpis]
MSSTNVPKKAPREPKVLLRSTSFQKLCSVSYNFKIEAIQSYKEHIKTVIKLLKIATRVYVISVYFKFITTVLFNEFVVKLYTQLKKNYTTANEASYPSKLDFEHSAPPQSRGPIVSNFISHYKTFVQTILAYTCIGYIGLEIISLVTTLWLASNIPLGLVFLMLDLSYIGFIMCKIALH